MRKNIFVRLYYERYESKGPIMGIFTEFIDSEYLQEFIIKIFWKFLLRVSIFSTWNS